MSGKVLKPILIGAAIIAVGVATGGIGFAAAGSANGFLAGALGAGLSVGVGTITTTALGGALLAAGLGTALSGVAAGLQKTPKATLGQIDRLNATINPLAPRVMVLGRQVAMGTDIRYVEPSGNDQEYIDYIIAVAAHRVVSIDKLYIDAKLAWSSAGGSLGEYAGYLSVVAVLEGNADNTISINGGAKWGASRRLTGCAYLHIRIKRTGNSKKAESPFSGGLSSRLTIVGDGMPMYDPRFDSTAGGSGPMRASDQSTWAVEYAGVSIADNLPLQQLARLIGWRINGRLSVGDGFPVGRVDMDDFITAANLADEPILLSSGGTQRRYTGELVANENDQPSQVRALLMAGCNGQLRIRAGKIGLWLAHNDLAEAAADDGLNDDDVLSAFTFVPAKLEETKNVVRGQFTDPSEASLYQMKDYPEVRLASRDGIDRVLPINLSVATNAPQAQRTVKQALQRLQYGWRFSATFGERAAKYRPGSLVPLTFAATSFVRKLFRVEMMKPGFNGRFDMVLLEEDPQLYAWDQDERAAVQAAPAIRFDPLNSPIIQGISEAGETANWSQVVDDDGNKPEPGATFGMTPDEAAELAALQADTAAALLAIAAAEGEIDAIEASISVDVADLQARILAAEGDISTLETGITTANAGISSLWTAVSNVEGDLASITTRVGAAETTIEIQQLAIDTIDTQVATVSTNLTTALANISLNATAITTLQGSQATLSSTVAAQGSSITTLQSATATLQGQAATLETRVSSAGNNLLPNGSFENGLTNWSANIPGWSAAPSSAGWGSYAFTNHATPDTGYSILYANNVAIYPSTTYTLSADVGQFNTTAGTALHYLQIDWYQADGTTYISSNAGPGRNANTDFDPTGQSRQALKVTATAPSNAGYAQVLIVWYKASGTVISEHVRQVKLERGTVASRYSQEASVVQNYATLSTLNTNYASLSSTVSVQGVTVSSHSTAISTLTANDATLFGRYGVEIGVGGYWTGFVLNNNGSRGDAIFDVDFFGVGKAGAFTSLPFQIIGSNTYLKNAVIQNAAIDTLKVAGNAITVPLIVSSGGSHVGDGTYQSIASGGLTLDQAGVVFISTVIAQVYVATGVTFELRIKVNGTIVGSVGGGAVQVAVPCVAALSLGAGSHSIEIDWFAPPSITMASDITYVQGAKR